MDNSFGFFRVNEWDGGRGVRWEVSSAALWRFHDPQQFDWRVRRLCLQHAGRPRHLRGAVQGARDDELQLAAGAEPEGARAAAWPVRQRLPHLARRLRQFCQVTHADGSGRPCLLRPPRPHSHQLPVPVYHDCRWSSGKTSFGVKASEIGQKWWTGRSTFASSGHIRQLVRLFRNNAGVPPMLINIWVHQAVPAIHNKRVITIISMVGTSSKGCETTSAIYRTFSVHALYNLVILFRCPLPMDEHTMSFLWARTRGRWWRLWMLRVSTRMIRWRALWSRSCRCCLLVFPSKTSTSSMGSLSSCLTMRSRGWRFRGVILTKSHLAGAQIYYKDIQHYEMMKELNLTKTDNPNNGARKQFFVICLPW